MMVGEGCRRTSDGFGCRKLGPGFESREFGEFGGEPTSTCIEGADKLSSSISNMSARLSDKAIYTCKKTKQHAKCIM